MTEPNQPIRVAVVDDQPLLVSAFTALIDHEPDLAVVATGADGRQAVGLVAEHELDVIVMDIRMPHLDGVAATGQITARGDRPRVLILTTFNVDELVLGAVRAGARGFLLKDSATTNVVDAIRAVHRGEAVVDSQAAPALLTALRTPGRETPAGSDSLASDADPEVPDAVAALTPRELEVLRLIATGLTNAEMAADLVIAETTVKTHVGNLLWKLDARDRVALVVLAHSVGLVNQTDRLAVPLPHEP